MLLLHLLPSSGLLKVFGCCIAVLKTVSLCIPHDLTFGQIVSVLKRIEKEGPHHYAFMDALWPGPEKPVRWDDGSKAFSRPLRETRGML